MAGRNLKKVLAVLSGISAGDVERATEYIDERRFLQHNPYAPDGVPGLRQFIEQAPREQLHLNVVRAIEDGPYVVTEATGQRSGRDLFFDVFLFESGLVVEHWAFSSEVGQANESGHTQLDGPTAPTHLELTEENKAAVRRYYETFHIAGQHDFPEEFFADDLMIRHEPGVRDGVANFLADVAVLMKERTIDEIKLLLGEGDLVFVAAKGTHRGAPCVYVDLYRVEQGKIVEHWGFPEAVPPPHECRNQNGML